MNPYVEGYRRGRHWWRCHQRDGHDPTYGFADALAAAEKRRTPVFSTDEEQVFWRGYYHGFSDARAGVRRPMPRSS